MPLPLSSSSLPPLFPCDFSPPRMVVMSLGKRTRPMRRTTSIGGITFDLNVRDEPRPSYSPGSRSLIDGWDGRFLATVPLSMVHRRYSSEFVDSTHFLCTCCFCKRSLVPGRDIYMYRGDIAFCSLECRQHQMNLDERKEKCSLASNNESAASAAAAAGSSKGETVAAV